ncbi:hypothetical protein HPB50_019825 [Hyalomma asiaticum]|uniref:Uncharacterized protein n=1 Tax=Hyalomma asiaticum TaxID=266040 RepID=A0ACB7RYP3_HYAAI|nr:hypothetical protein HPB50_019825 [Hyalomma asiaticum]
MKQLVLLALFGVALGPCKGYFPKWWYNVETGQCEEFIYGGCQGNDNRYDTKEECEKTCATGSGSLDVSPRKNHQRSHVHETPDYSAVNLNGSLDVSALERNSSLVNRTRHNKSNETSEYSPVVLAAGDDFNTYCKPQHDRGPCKAYLPRMWYNANTRRCEQFIYGGCQGNKNNYKTKAACEAKCLRRRSALEVSAEVQRYPDPKNNSEHWFNVTSEYNATNTNTSQEASAIYWGPPRVAAHVDHLPPDDDEQYPCFSQW